MTNQTRTIPKGYKQTEVGVIPDDWEMNKLAQVHVSLGQKAEKVGIVRFGM
jgi:hypothetical protein